MTDFNPSFPLRPTWIDGDYLFSGKQQQYREKWEAVAIERADELLKRCARKSANVAGACFGYKGTRLIEGKAYPRLAVCVTADRKFAWVDVNAFPDDAPSSDAVSAGFLRLGKSK